MIIGDHKYSKLYKMESTQSDYELVKVFTEESGVEVSAKPRLMTKGEVMFLVKMMLDEIMELGATIEDPDTFKLEIIDIILASKDILKIENVPEVELIAEQGDALVDCYYYSLNAAAKCGVNISKIFQIVHQANMDKRDPVSGKFLKREDGKIIKPDGWKAPDIIEEIKRQMGQVE